MGDGGGDERWAAPTGRRGRMGRRPGQPSAVAGGQAADVRAAPALEVGEVVRARASAPMG